MQKPKIDFIGVGAPRAATTWISECLREHPDICFSQPKETGFFNHKHLYTQDLARYGDFFKHCDKEKISGEYTPGYFYKPLTAQKIHTAYPDVKILICLRNPIERAWSHVTKHDIAGVPTPPFKKITDKTKSKYIDLGFYSKRVQLYFDLFKRENVHIAIYEDIEKAPAEFVRCIYEFLGVDAEFIPKNLDRRINHLGFLRPRNKSLGTLLHKIERKFSQIDNMPSIVEKMIASFAKWNITKQGAAIPINIDDAERKKLRRLYQDDITKTGELIGRDLSMWR